MKEAFGADCLAREMRAGEGSMPRAWKPAWVRARVERPEPQPMSRMRAFLGRVFWRRERMGGMAVLMGPLKAVWWMWARSSW